MMRSLNTTCRLLSLLLTVLLCLPIQAQDTITDDGETDKSSEKSATPASSIQKGLDKITPEKPVQTGIAGGIYDKPFMFDLGGRLAIGGYVDAQLRYEREEGTTTELGFVLERINLFLFAPVSDRIRIAAEFEYEEGGEEIKIELAMVDFEIAPALTFRAGILLSPLGRFNIAHDSPANDLTDRPLVSTELIPATFSEVGMGFLGTLFPYEGGQLSYEAYLVNGFTDEIVTGSGDGTRFPAGKRNLEDTNLIPSFVGRLGYRPWGTWVEVGVSGHVGRYNTVAAEDLQIDIPRLASILAVDLDFTWEWLRITGEYAHGWVEIPEQLEGIYATRQQGLYAEVRGRFLEGLLDALPRSSFAAAARFGWVDFDRDLDGDDVFKLIVGLNFRPTEETVFKLDYTHSWLFDRFNNPVREAGLLFSVATYF